MAVKIYISDHCFSCKEAVHFFEKKGILFQLINVTQDQARFDEMVSLGGIATPFIVIGKQIFHYVDREKIERALEDENG
jgi:glutaredoxin